MKRYFIVGSCGKELGPYSTRERARVSKRFEPEYENEYILSGEPDWMIKPLCRPIKIVRREYQLVEEKVVR